MSDLPQLRQVAALPWRKGRRGVEVLLITSRETARWVIPKGWAMAGLADHASAAEEAREEAGADGEAASGLIGSYEYDKRRRNGAVLRIEVAVYALEVSKLLRVWPEKAERKRKWFAPAKAAALVAEPGLSAIINDLEARMRTRLALPAPRPKRRSRSTGALS
jgi:8-oxo-dGTP pyrophosphatase MutT (NUDIX family)